MAHVIKTGNIVTPAKPLVTGRKSVTVKMGRDDAPLPPSQYVVASMATGTAVVGFQKKVIRESLATERAKVGPATPVAARILTGAEQDVRDAMARVFRDEDGKIVRTVDMGDEPLVETAAARYVETDRVLAERAAADAARVAEQDAKKAARAAKKAERDERDAEILAYLRAKGYKGHLSADIRTLALDAMEQDRQVREYATR